MVMFGGTPPVPMQKGSAPAGVAASPRTIVAAKIAARTTRRIISTPSVEFGPPDHGAEGW